MIITIDGPAGAGKSTAAKLLAARLGFQFLDTGAMYRAVTWAAIQRGLSFEDSQALVGLTESLEICLENDRIWVDGREVTSVIREPEITANVSAVADNPGVRERLVQLQRKIAAEGDFVCEGRDQGTVVFPDAICKIYLTASADQRAQRRVDQMQLNGLPADFEEIIRQQNERDRRDLSRPVGRLMRAADAVEVTTDGMLLGEVIDELEDIARAKISLVE